MAGVFGGKTQLKSYQQCHAKICLKMLYLIGPDGLVNLSSENFQKMVWMTIVHVLDLESRDAYNSQS